MNSRFFSLSIVSFVGFNLDLSLVGVLFDLESVLGSVGLLLATAVVGAVV